MIINQPGFWSLVNPPSFRGRFGDHTNLQARVRQGVRALVVDEILLEFAGVSTGGGACGMLAWETVGFSVKIVGFIMTFITIYQQNPTNMMLNALVEGKIKPWFYSRIGLAFQFHFRNETILGCWRVILWLLWMIYGWLLALCPR